MTHTTEVAALFPFEIFRTNCHVPCRNAYQHSCDPWQTGHKGGKGAPPSIFHLPRAVAKANSLVMGVTTRRTVPTGMGGMVLMGHFLHVIVAVTVALMYESIEQAATVLNGLALGPANHSCKGADRKQLSLCRPYCLCHNSPLLLTPKPHRQHFMCRAGLCSRGIFTYRHGISHNVHVS